MQLVDIWEGNVVFNCETCNGTGEFRMSRHDTDPDWCHECAGNGAVAFYMGTLFANLAIAAGLCAAFSLGHQSQAVYIGSEYASGPIDEPWRPGCQRPAFLARQSRGMEGV